MRSTWTVAAASLTAVALLAGCADDKTSTVTAPTVTTVAGSGTTTLTAATTTPVAVKSAEALKAALLVPADVAGSAVGTQSQQDFDISSCFPDNPFGARTDAAEVKSPGLELTDGSVTRQYGSKARQATPQQAKAFVAAFATPAASACVLEAFKKRITDNPTSGLDPSGLAGLASSPSAAAVADGGGMLSIKGNLAVGTQAVPVDADLLVFQKGSVVVYLSVSATGGAKVPNQTLELAQKVAGRLS